MSQHLPLPVNVLKSVEWADFLVLPAATSPFRIPRAVVGVLP